MPDWICSFAHGDLKPCHKPADWLIDRDGLTVGACYAHREAIIQSLTPKVRIRNVAALKELASQDKAGSK